MDIERLSPPGEASWLGGVDEAGRGPVIGPMVIAGVAIRDVIPLVDMGVRDSKVLSRRSREALFDRILPVSEVVVITLPAGEIDAMMSRMTLNEIEVEAFAALIRELSAGQFKVDAIGPVDALSRNLSRITGKEVTARTKADSHYPVVSAASIVAKVLRDRAVDEITREMGEDIGSGYPSDPVTMEFLERYVTENGSLPPHARASWKTSSRLLDRKIDDF